MRRFFIVAMPRSRTAWLANFFTSGKSVCLHEPLTECAKVEDLRWPDAEVCGVADTMLTAVIGNVLKTWPQARFIVVRRDPAEVFESVEAMGLNAMNVPAMAELLDRADALIEASGAAMARLDFNALSDIGALRTLWEFIVGDGFDERRASWLIDVNVQAEYSSILRRIDVQRLNLLIGSQYDCPSMNTNH